MSRYYDVGKLKYPSVTTIIGDCTDKSQPLMQWASNECVAWIRENCSRVFDIMESSYGIEHLDDLYVTENNLNDARFAYKNVSKEALDVGSEVHGYIEKYLKTGDFGVTGIVTEITEVHNAIKAFHEWEESVDLKPISVEKTVYGNGWGGTLDFLGTLGGKLYVIDWKSGKAIYPEMRYQIAAYRWAVNHLPGQIDADVCQLHDIEGCGILRLDKSTGLPQFKDTSKTYEKDLNVFNKMVELYFARHPRIARNAGRG